MFKPTGTLGFITDLIRPETGLQAFNTLEDARNIQDLTTRFKGGDDSAYDEFEDYLNRNKLPIDEGGRDDNRIIPIIPEEEVEEEIIEDPKQVLTPRILGSYFDPTFFAADGGRMGFFLGGGDTSTAKSYDSGAVSKTTQAQKTAMGGGGNGGPKTTPTNVGGGDGPKFDIFNPIDSIKAKLLDYAGVTLEDVVRAKSIEDDEEKNLQEILAGAITNQPEFQSNIDATISGIMDNPDLAALGTIKQGMAEGGIASLDREAFLLGGIAKGLKKAVRGVKKLVKSPIGKAALLASPFLIKQGLFSSLIGQKAMTQAPFAEGTGLMGLFEKGLKFAKENPFKTIGGLSLFSGLTAEEDKGNDALAAYYAQNQLTPSQSVRGMGSEFDFYGGQRMRVADGGDVEPVAKKTMPLLDMGGKEKDYRETGGFVDMGRMERADDVPARLSKNEFVFTADAVRNAGEGDIDKGAEVMYNMMKNLEAGGEVSEESQGLEGARKMFQTSQRLGEVI